VSGHTIELIYFEGCLNVDAARRHLGEAIASSGRSITWTEWDTDSAATPERYRRYGSPTVLVNGQDVTGSGGEAEASACRADGAPPVSAILAALG
jgi:hypothetical protein